jgi:hypothetical protein
MSVRLSIGMFQFGPNWADFLQDILNFVAELIFFLQNPETQFWKHW